MVNSWSLRLTTTCSIPALLGCGRIRRRGRLGGRTNPTILAAVRRPVPGRYDPVALLNYISAVDRARRRSIIIHTGWKMLTYSERQKIRHRLGQDLTAAKSVICSAAYRRGHEEAYFVNGFVAAADGGSVGYGNYSGHGSGRQWSGDSPRGREDYGNSNQHRLQRRHERTRQLRLAAAQGRHLHGERHSAGVQDLYAHRDYATGAGSSCSRRPAGDWRTHRTDSRHRRNIARPDGYLLAGAGHHARNRLRICRSTAGTTSACCH